MSVSRREALAIAGAFAATAAARPLFAHDWEEIALWPGTPPGRGSVKGPEKIGESGAAKGAISNVSTPRMRVYRPATPNGRAVLVCGGGGYFRIQLERETGPAARWLQNRGYTVFELIYRLPADGWEASAPFADAQRAMKIIRSRADEFDINPRKIGIMGMSAGGHLAGFTALQPARALYSGKDRFEAASARPDFAALLFPVVTLKPPFDTTRTRREIVGEHPDAAAAAAWSLETYAAKDAPPMVLFSASDDTTAPPDHNLALYNALRAAGASVELHIFANGGHGWGLGTPDQTLAQWPELFDAWVHRVADKT